MFVFLLLYRVFHSLSYVSTHQTPPWSCAPSSTWTTPMRWCHATSWQPSTNRSWAPSLASTWPDRTSPTRLHLRRPASRLRHLHPAPLTKTIRTTVVRWVTWHPYRKLAISCFRRNKLCPFSIWPSVCVFLLQIECIYCSILFLNSFHSLINPISYSTRPYRLAKSVQPQMLGKSPRHPRKRRRKTQTSLRSPSRLTPCSFVTPRRPLKVRTPTLRLGRSPRLSLPCGMVWERNRNRYMSIVNTYLDVCIDTVVCIMI